MKLVSITPVRNEAWCWGFTLRALLRWVDHAVVMIHASDDDTLAITAEVAAEHPGRVTSWEDRDPVWREMDHRQALLDAARRAGATHIATVDADEFLTGNLLDTIRGQASCLPMGSYLQVPMPNLWGSLEKYATMAQSQHGRYRTDWGKARTTAVVADHPKCGWRATSGYDHHHREPFNARLGLAAHYDGGLAHLQFANWRRLVAKHAAYKIEERLRWPEKPVADIEAMYNLAIKMPPAIVATVPADWWEPYADIKHHIRMDTEPWQEQWCREQFEKHGPEKFSGLDLFGVCQCEPVGATS